jgi:hypothetical protein
MTQELPPQDPRMLTTGHSLPAPSASATEESPAFPRIHQPEDLLSPSIQRSPGESVPAFELKFLLAEVVAQQVEAWAAEHLERDVFAGPERGGSYQTTTLYLDTPGLDVFYRTRGFRGRKYRLRRYGEDERVYLERKSRRGDRVKKRRCDVPLADLAIFPFDGAAVDWPGLWFRDRIGLRALQPVCRISYERTAFVQATSEGPVRLTLDRQIRGLPSAAWDLPPVRDGRHILAGQVICEFKFRAGLPALFKDLIADLKIQPASISKYRRVMTAAGVANDGTMPNV